MRVIPDIRGGDASEDGNGLSLARLFRCLEVETARDNVLLACLTDSRVPRVGDPHPRRGDLFVLRKSLITSDAPGDYLVRVEYGPPDQSGAGAGVGSVTRSLRSELITEETFEALDGTKMTTRYVSRFAVGGGGASITISELVHTVEVQRPSFSLVWDRIESGIPESLAFAAAGTVNAAPWRGRPRDTWLLNVESVEERAGRCRTTYTATYNASGWQARITHAEGGIIPLDVDKRNGIHEYQVYRRYDFARLGLR